MGPMPRLTFLPGGPAPAAGRLAWWHPHPADPGHEPLERSHGTEEPGAHQDRLAAAWRHSFGRPVAGEATEIEVFEGSELVVAPAMVVPLLPAITVLAALPSPTQASEGDRAPRDRSWAAGRVHPSVQAWSVAAKWALEIVAAGRIVPVLAGADDPRHAVAWWRAAVLGDSRLDALAAAMPIEGFATPRSATEVWSARDLLSAFCDAVADACGRQGRQPTLDVRRRAGEPHFGARAIGALTGSDPIVEGPPALLRTRIRELSDWSAAVTGATASVNAGMPVHLVVRVVPPSTDDGDGDGDAWRLRFGLGVQDHEDIVEAAVIWQRDESVVIGDVRLADAREPLVRWLAVAGRLMPAIGRCMHDAAPSEVAVSTAEAGALIDHPELLRSAGIRVEIPSSLRGAGVERARLVARIGRLDGQAVEAQVDDGALLSMSALTSARIVAQVGDEEVDAAEFAALVSAGPGLVQWRGRWVRVEPGVVEASDQVGRDVAMSLTEALAAALTGQHRLDGVGTVDSRPVGDVASAVERLRSTSAPAPVADADLAGFRGSLRTYQRIGVAWLRALADLGFGAVLADEMGLGKTVEAIGLLSTRPGASTHLVVCPTSVVGNWVRELDRFAPDMAVTRHHGPDRAMRPDVLDAADVVVTTYALLRRDQALLRRVAWDVVVFDEAQQVKNPASQTARAARGLPCRSRLAMTGTPLENRLGDLWSIVDLTNPGLLGRRATFDEQFTVPIERWRDDRAARRLRRLVAPFLLRRRKQDPEVAVDLPPKTEVEVTCMLTREQVALYQAVIEETLSGRLTGSTFERRGRILALLTALKQICDHPLLYAPDGGRIAGRSGKLERATELLGEIIDSEGHALVFTQYRRMGALLVEHLQQALGLEDVPFLHGGVPAARRDALVARFQESEAVPIMVVSLRAGGTGLNLTRANHVIHVDRWWNPAVEDQATDRAHRIGQHRPVTVHTLVTAGTLEERIAAMLARKRELAEAVMGTGQAWVTELSDDEIRDLVSLSSDAMVGSWDDGDEDAVAGGDDDRPAPRLVALPGGRR